MSTGHAIQTALEILFIAAIIVGLFHEPVIAKWEEKQKEKVLKAFNRRKEYRR